LRDLQRRQRLAAIRRTSRSASGAAASRSAPYVTVSGGSIRAVSVWRSASSWAITATS